MMRFLLSAALAVALLTGSAEADSPASATHGAGTPTIWACATHDTTFGTEVTKYRVDTDKLVDLSDIEFWLKLRSEIAPVSDDLRREIEQRSTYRILKDTSVGLIAVQGGAELLGGDHPSVSASVIMIDKKTGGFRSLILSEERLDRFGQPQSDTDDRGKCTVVTP
jgi:hypothetical protein